MMKFKTAALVSRTARWKNRKLWLLVTLALLLGFSVWYHAKGEPESTLTAAAPRTAVPAPREKTDAMQSADPRVYMVELRNELQERPQEGGHRNLYEFGAPPPPPPLSKEAEAAKLAAAAAAPPPPQSVCGDKVCQAGEDWQNCPTDCEAPLPEITLKYIGFLKEHDGVVAFFTDTKGKEVFMARLNEVVANRYRVLKITEESVELGYLNVNQSKTIQFQGNNKS